MSGAQAAASAAATPSPDANPLIAEALAQGLADGMALTPDMPPLVVDQVAVARLYGEPLFTLPLTCTSRPTRWRSFSKPSRARWTCCCT